MIDTTKIYEAMVPLGPSVAKVRAAFEGKYPEYVGPELAALRAVAPEFGWSGDPKHSAAWYDEGRPCTIVCVLDGVIGFAFQEISMNRLPGHLEMDADLRAKVRGILDARRKGGWPRFKKRRAS